MSRPFFLMVRKSVRKTISESISWVTINVIYICAAGAIVDIILFLLQGPHIYNQGQSNNRFMNRS